MIKKSLIQLILAICLSGTAYSENSFYQSSSVKLTGYGARIWFSYSGLYFRDRQSSTWAQGRLGNFQLRDEWSYKGSGRDNGTHLALAVLQRSKSNRYHYSVGEMIRSLKFFKNKPLRIHSKRKMLKTRLGTYEVTAFKYAYQDLKKVCLAFSSNDVHPDLYVRGYSCTDAGLLPHPKALACTLNSLQIPRFNIRGKLLKDCDGKQVTLQPRQLAMTRKRLKRSF